MRHITLLVGLFTIGVLSMGCTQGPTESEGTTESSVIEQSEQSEQEQDLEEQPDESSNENTGDSTDTDSGDKSAGQIFDQVELGMTRVRVEELAGRSPVTTPEIETEKLGKIVNLIYQSGPSDRSDVVTISFQDDELKTALLVEWEDGQVSSKIKGEGL